MDTILHPFQRTGKDCINILNLGYDYSIGSLDKLDVKPHLQNQHISSFVVDSLSESKEKLAKEHDSNPGVRLKVFFDITNARDDFKNPWWVDTPLLKNLAEKKIRFKEREWERRFFIKVKNLDKDEIKGSFIVQAFYRKNGKLFFIGQQDILSCWQRKNCGNCMERSKAAVGFFVSNEMAEHAFKSDNLVVQILNKDPENCESVIKNIEALSENPNLPQIQKLVSFEQQA